MSTQKTLKQLDKLNKRQVLDYIRGYGIGKKLNTKRESKQSLLDYAIRNKLIAPVPSIDTASGTKKTELDQEPLSPAEMLTAALDKFSKVKTPSLNNVIAFLKEIPLKYKKEIDDHINNGLTARQIRDKIKGLSDINKEKGEAFDKAMSEYATGCFTLFDTHLAAVFPDWFESFAVVNETTGHLSKSVSAKLVKYMAKSDTDISTSKKCLKLFVQIRGTEVDTPKSLQPDQIIKGSPTKRMSESDTSKNISLPPSNIRKKDKVVADGK